MNIKKLLTSVVAAATVMCATAVPAFAAPDGFLTCSLCQSGISIGRSYNVTNGKTYEEVYNVPTLSGLTSELDCAYYAEDLWVVSYNGEPICKDCLETKINEYKAAHEDTSDTETSSGTTNVTASVSSNCTIVIPESVTLSKTDNVAGSGEYTKSFEVKVKGDVPEDGTVTITATNPTLKATGAKDVTAVLTMDKTQWNRSDIIANSGEGTASNCTLTATLTPGTWTGTMTYNIVLNGKFSLAA